MDDNGDNRGSNAGRRRYGISLEFDKLIGRKLPHHGAAAEFSYIFIRFRDDL